MIQRCPIDEKVAILVDKEGYFSDQFKMRFFAIYANIGLTHWAKYLYALANQFIRYYFFTLLIFLTISTRYLHHFCRIYIELV